MFQRFERSSVPELLDGDPDSISRAERKGNLEDIARLNRWFGNAGIIVEWVAGLSKEMSGEEIALLDVATGGADIPVAIASWARRAGVRVRITAVDIDFRALEIASEGADRYPEISLAAADGFELPFRRGSFDYVLCSKTLHHFTEGQAVRLLQEFRRVARRGYLVVDLRRSRFAWVLILLMTRVFSRNRLTRTDGPLSVRRSFSPAELSAIAKRSATPRFSVSRRPYCLLVLEGRVAGTETTPLRGAEPPLPYRHDLGENLFDRAGVDG